MRGEVVDALPESLKIVVSCAAGYDSYDGAALAKRNIALCNAPGLSADPVADLVLYYALSLFRYTHVFEHITQEHKNTITCRTSVITGQWDNQRGRPVLHANNKNDPAYKPEADHAPKFAYGDRLGDRAVRQPRGHTVGIVGFGAIGVEIGRRLSSIGMTVLYTKRSPLPADQQAQLGYPATFHESVETMFPQSDLVVLACPLNPKSHHIVNERTLQLMPAGARVVNIGRGPLIDTPALVRALQSGHIHGAGLDVFEREPIVDEGLLGRWDVILTPHMGSASLEAAEGSEIICIGNIMNCYKGDTKALTQVN